MSAIVIRDDRYDTAPELYKTLNDARAAVVLKILDDPYVLRDDDLLKTVLQAIEAGDFVDAIDAWNEAQGATAEEKGVYFRVTPCRLRSGTRLTKTAIREKAAKILRELDEKD